MKCPYIIEPHQIQGLDFINIYPLIQWLIKYSSEFRDAKEDELRKFAVMQYDKDYIFESDRIYYIQNEKMLKNLIAVQVILKKHCDFYIKLVGVRGFARLFGHLGVNSKKTTKHVFNKIFLTV